VVVCGVSSRWESVFGGGSGFGGGCVWMEIC